MQARLSMRNRSLARLKSGLDLQQLQSFFVHIVKQTTPPQQTAASKALLLIQKQQQLSGNSLFREDDDLLNDCATIIADFVCSHHDLSSSLAFEAHTLLGCIQGETERHKLAAGSFLRALWIASISNHLSEEDVALTMHRLGRAYGASGSFRDASNLLESALVKYTQAGLRPEHAVVVEAREYHATFQSLLQERTRKEAREEQEASRRRGGARNNRRPWQSFSVGNKGSKGKRLAPLIEEETERRCSF